MSKTNKVHSQTQSRENVILYFYQFELLKTEIDPFENYDFNEQELKMIDWIKKKYQFLKKNIVKFLLPTWPWERLMPLERAILIVGTFELNIRDKKIVINEMVNYAKKYIVEDKYKFINSILDKIGKEYDKKKRS